MFYGLGEEINVKEILHKVYDRFRVYQTENMQRNSIVYRKGKLPITINILIEKIGQKCSLQMLDGNETITSIVAGDNGLIKSGTLFIPYCETDAECAKKIKRGAVAILSWHPIEGLPCVVCADPSLALYAINKWLYDDISIPSIAVAGSEGKTTTKRMISAVCSTTMQTFSQTDNYNTFEALCDSIQLLQPGTEIIVQEIDEKRTKGMEKCSKILCPEIAIITNIKEAHQQFYKTREALIGSFRGITSGMPDNGILIINSDDTDSASTDFGRKKISVAIYDKNADYVAENIRYENGNMAFDIQHKGESVHIRLSMLGEHNIYNAMMAYVAGRLKGISISNIQKALAGYKNYGIRQNVCKILGTLIYADCYNASKTTIRYAIKCFDSMQCRGKKAAILGDIGEIEGYEEETYKAIAKYMEDSEIDALITYGKDSSMILKDIGRNMVKHHCATLEELASQIEFLKKDGYKAFLFKASHFIHLENGIRRSFPLHYLKIMLEEKLSRRFYK